MSKKKEKYPELMQWFDFMNDQFEKIEESSNKGKLNSLLFDNEIESIK